MTLPTIAIGQRHHRLIVTAMLPAVNGKAMCQCLCDCGKTTIARAGNIRSGVTKSCGCYRLQQLREALSRRKKIHGGWGTSEYDCWRHMIRRCYNPKQSGYQNYGGRGIQVCARWKEDFRAFLADMGPKPSKSHSLDRINNDGNYEPSNCRWATCKEQNNNRRKYNITAMRLEELLTKEALLISYQDRFGSL